MQPKYDEYYLCNGKINAAVTLAEAIMDTKDPVILGRGEEILYYTKSLLQLCKEKQEKIDASVLMDDVLQSIGKGIQAVDELTGGRLSTVLSAIDPAAWGTGVRRGLRDGFGASQRIAQNAGDFVQYSGELALLCCTFGSGTAVKGAKVATAATRSVKVAETAAVAKKTKRLAQLDKMVAENVAAKAEGIWAI